MFKKKKKSQLIKLIDRNVFKLNEKGRIELTVSCRDADYIPKVKNAGDKTVHNGVNTQVLFNGILVEKDCYYGVWMTEIISRLKGHHEPQEEKTFYEVLKVLGKSPGIMIELGAYWSFYSIWFAKENRNNKIICVEPDPSNLDVGRRNTQLNGVSEQATFINAASGNGNGELIDFDTENNGSIKIPLLGADELMASEELENVSILHMDIQGYELDALLASTESIRQNKIRFIFISTHHYAFSKDPMIHQKCINLLKSLGANIVTEHTVAETYSGDGLIVASFLKEDRDLKIRVSKADPREGLYRPYEDDLAYILGSNND